MIWLWTLLSVHIILRRRFILWNKYQQSTITIGTFNYYCKKSNTRKYNEIMSKNSNVFIQSALSSPKDETIAKCFHKYVGTIFYYVMIKSFISMEFIGNMLIKRKIIQ
jgi:hypothetical protein